MTEDRENLWESRDGQHKRYFRHHRRLLVLSLWRISLALRINASTGVTTRSSSCVSRQISSGEVITIIAESKNQMVLQATCPVIMAIRKMGFSET